LVPEHKWFLKVKKIVFCFVITLNYPAMFSKSEKTSDTPRNQSAADNLSRSNGSPAARQAKSPLQLKSGGPEDDAQLKRPVQLEGPLKEDDEIISKKSVAQKVTAPSAENKTGMPDQLKTGVETLSGFDLSDVKVHYNSSQPAQLNALAYAQGSDIHIGPGQEQHLPHEAWHVVQQRQGRVQPTTQMKEESVPINDDPHLENEADVMGQKSLQIIP
jgi:hypothetical protein